MLASRRTENFRLMGEYYWLVGKQRKAIKWFDKSIKEGERLSQEYLNKAEALFREMDLQWDLEQLEQVRAGA